jgi:Transglutaminase-like superfamily
MGHAGESSRRDKHWLLDAWSIKLASLRKALSLYARAAYALVLARFFPASQMRKLDDEQLGYPRLGEDIVLRYTGKWFALLEKLGIRAPCLIRSLALAKVLRQEGYDAHIVFGVRSENGEMEGHCWVAIGNRAVTEAPASFKELYNE